jgi:hypothetical protein|tara:strand:- start:342 stop:446 length:105 start_codon:yes stop_codon:yes gene_type:complete
MKKKQPTKKQLGKAIARKYINRAKQIVRKFKNEK